MALRRYECVKCGKEYERLDFTKDLKDCPECGALNSPSLPKNLTAHTFETKDKRRGVKHRKGQERQLKKRMKEHHARYEAHREVDKYGLDDAISNGTLKKVKKI